MSKRQTRLFFLVSTAVLAVIFIGLTVDAHRAIPRLTHAAGMTPAVIAGDQVWHAYNCVNCHTLLGEGAYYAPDLTHIYSQRSAPYLTAFLQDPSRFYSEERDRRLMPTLGLSDAQIAAVVAFLGWVDKIENNGWPPRPLLVSGSAIPGQNIGTPPRSPASNNPVELGDAVFHRSPPACFTCHSVSPGVNLVGPSLAGIKARAEERLKAPDYKGTARDAAGYIRESILDPNRYISPGGTYAFNGRSVMPDNFRTVLKPDEVDELITYLETLK